MLFRSALGYIAGLLDGEGNIQWRRRSDRQHSAVVSIYSTTTELIDWLAVTMRGGRVRWDSNRTVRHGWKPIGSWQVSRVRDVQAVLSALDGLLIIKRDLAREVLAELDAAHGQIPA